MPTKQTLSLRAYVYVAETAAIGATICFFAATHWAPVSTTRTIAYLISAVMSAMLKVRLPGRTGTVSLSFLFILLGNMELSLGEILIVGFASAIAQSYWRKKQPASLIQLWFNLGNFALSIAAARVVYQWQWLASLDGGNLFRVVASAMVYFFVNHFSVAAIICLSERRDLTEVWNEWRGLTLPYHIAGATILLTLHEVNGRYGWEIAIVIMPALMYLYRSYSRYLEMMERALTEADEQRFRAEEMAKMHLRTIEVLEMAINARADLPDICAGSDPFISDFVNKNREELQ